MIELAEYIADNYGSCVLGSACVCLKPGNAWLGRACHSWRPVPYKNWDEMKKALQDGKENV